MLGPRSPPPWSSASWQPASTSYQECRCFLVWVPLLPGAGSPSHAYAAGGASLARGTSSTPAYRRPRHRTRRARLLAQSTYRWEGKVTTDAELLLIIKTRQALLPQLTAAVRELHPYEECEVRPAAGAGDAFERAGGRCFHITSNKGHTMKRGTDRVAHAGAAPRMRGALRCAVCAPASPQSWPPAAARRSWRCLSSAAARATSTGWRAAPWGRPEPPPAGACGLPLPRAEPRRAGRPPGICRLRRLPACRPLGVVRVNRRQLRPHVGGDLRDALARVLHATVFVV